jgi:hypothetical protein
MDKAGRHGGGFIGSVKGLMLRFRENDSESSDSMKRDNIFTGGITTMWSRGTLYHLVGYLDLVKVKLSLCCLTEHHALKAYWGVEV